MDKDAFTASSFLLILLSRKAFPLKHFHFGRICLHHSSIGISLQTTKIASLAARVCDFCAEVVLNSIVVHLLQMFLKFTLLSPMQLIPLSCLPHCKNSHLLAPCRR